MSKICHQKTGYVYRMCDLTEAPNDSLIDDGIVTISVCEQDRSLQDTGGQLCDYRRRYRGGTPGTLLWRGQFQLLL